MSEPNPELFAAERDEAADQALAELRYVVRASIRSQRSVERENGFRRGYLSQVLKGNIALTVRHLIGILRAVDVPPSTFFSQLEAGSSVGHVPILMEIRERMARYDAALEQLAEKGLLDPLDPTEPQAEAIGSPSDATPSTKY